MLRNVFLKTLRDNRWGIVGVGLGVALILLVTITAYPSLFTGSAAERARQAQEMENLFRSFSVLLGEPVPIDNIGGFLTFRNLNFMPMFLGLWTLIVAAGLIRGEEEQGALDVLLTTPHGRIAVFWQKLAALGLGLVVVLALVGAGLWAGVAAINDSLPTDRVLAELLNLGLATAFWGATALLISQFVRTRRTTSTIVGGLMFATYVIDNLAEGLDSLKWLTWILPFHYVAINKPLVPGRAIDYGAWIVLAALTILLVGLALWMFQRRDLGSVFALLPAPQTANARGGSLALLGSVFAKNVRDLIGSTLGWGLTLGAVGALIVSTTNEALAPLRDAVRNVPWLGAVFGNLATPEGFLSGYMDAILPLFLTFFALIQIASWTDDEESGRMEVLAGEPLPRLQILLARYAAIVCSLIGILALMGAGVLATAAVTNVALDAGRVLGFLVQIGVLVLLVLAFGLALAAWLKRPGLALPITGGIIIVMFFLDLLGGMLNWPDALLNLSIYHLYGRPLLEGLAWGTLAGFVGAVVLLAAGSLAGFGRRDIAK